MFPLIQEAMKKKPYREYFTNEGTHLIQSV